LFLQLINKKKYRTDFQIEGSCNYAFLVILKNKNLKFRSIFEKTLLKNKIEFRRGNAGGGNQLRQPYLRKFTKNLNFKNFKEVDHIHFFGYYIGNYPSLSKIKIKKLCNTLNQIDI
jgi:CDP-6-deoxy-D-xylo-4-hexulose-3-dehydrase